MNKYTKHFFLSLLTAVVISFTGLCIKTGTLHAAEPALDRTVNAILPFLRFETQDGWLTAGQRFLSYNWGSDPQLRNGPGNNLFYNSDLMTGRKSNRPFGSMQYAHEFWLTHGSACFPRFNAAGSVSGFAGDFTGWGERVFEVSSRPSRPGLFFHGARGVHPRTLWTGYYIDAFQQHCQPVPGRARTWADITSGMTVTFWVAIAPESGGRYNKKADHHADGTFFAIRSSLGNTPWHKGNVEQVDNPLTDVPHYATLAYSGDMVDSANMPFKFVFRDNTDKQVVYSGGADTDSTYQNADFNTGLITAAGADAATMGVSTHRQNVTDLEKGKFMFVAIRMNKTDIKFNFGTQNANADRIIDGSRREVGDNVRQLSANHVANYAHNLPTGNAQVIIASPGSMMNVINGSGSRIDVASTGNDTNGDPVYPSVLSSIKHRSSFIAIHDSKSTRLRPLEVGGISMIEDMRIYGSALSDAQVGGVYSNLGNIDGMPLESPYYKPAGETVPYLRMDFDEQYNPSFASVAAARVPRIVSGAIYNPKLTFGFVTATNPSLNLTNAFYTDATNRLNSMGSGNALALDGDVDSFIGFRIQSANTPTSLPDITQGGFENLSNGMTITFWTASELEGNFAPDQDKRYFVLRDSTETNKIYAGLAFSHMTTGGRHTVDYYSGTTTWNKLIVKRDLITGGENVNFNDISSLTNNKWLFVSLRYSGRNWIYRNGGRYWRAGLRGERLGTTDGADATDDVSGGTVPQATTALGHFKNNFIIHNGGIAGNNATYITNSFGDTINDTPTDNNVVFQWGDIEMETKIDDFRIYSRVLEDHDVRTIYEQRGVYPTDWANNDITANNQFAQADNYLLTGFAELLIRRARTLEAKKLREQTFRLQVFQRVLDRADLNNDETIISITKNLKINMRGRNLQLSDEVDIIDAQGQVIVSNLNPIIAGNNSTDTDIKLNWPDIAVVNISFDVLKNKFKTLGQYSLRYKGLKEETIDGRLVIIDTSANSEETGIFNIPLPAQAIVRTMKQKVKLPISLTTSLFKAKVVVHLVDINGRVKAKLYQGELNESYTELLIDLSKHRGIAGLNYLMVEISSDNSTQKKFISLIIAE